MNAKLRLTVYNVIILYITFFLTAGFSIQVPNFLRICLKVNMFQAQIGSLEASDRSIKRVSRGKLTLPSPSLPEGEFSLPSPYSSWG